MTCLFKPLFYDSNSSQTTTNITHRIPITVNPVTTTTNLNFEIDINTTKSFHETTYTDNQGSDATNRDLALTLKPPVNPTNPGTAGTPGYGCPIGSVNTTKAIYDNSMVRYDINNSPYPDNPNYSYLSVSSRYRADTELYTESYTITDVRFRSKATTDAGNNWVSIKNQNALATVKAGNGYELAIDVRYTNDALVGTYESSIITTSGNKIVTQSGMRIPNARHAANLYKDIYVKTGNTVYSASGINGTVQALVPTDPVVNSDGTTTTYQMRTSVINGISTPERIYTAETAKDDSYQIQIWTPVITGFGHPDKPTTQLCDSLTTTYTVKGSMYDDLQDSIIQ